MTLSGVRQNLLNLHLTHREITILCLIATGRTSEQTAQALNLSYHHTVAQHVAAMLRKSGATNRSELIARGFVAGILDPDQWPPTPRGELNTR